MSDAYIGEIRLFTGLQAPNNWQICDGRLLNINDYQALFALIGTNYGGNGMTNFAIPDLRGRTIIHQGQLNGNGNNYIIGQKSGAETVQLTPAHTAHSHKIVVKAPSANAPDGNASHTAPGSKFIAASTTKAFTNQAPSSYLNPATVTSSGNVSAAPHDNMMPSLCVNYIICVVNGIFPPRN
jgi:microcystin-dependent protein